MKPQPDATYEALLGLSVSAIDTPALVIDLDAMERNLSRMMAFAKLHGVKLRPHAKMHKCAALAKLQMQAGAVGVCVQKTSEAERLADAGVTNIYISNEVVAPHKLQRVAALAQRLKNTAGRLAIAVDSAIGVSSLARAINSLQGGTPSDGALIDVFIELDVGHERCGVTSPQAVVELAQTIGRYSCLHFAGLQAYHGRAQHLRSVHERRDTFNQVLARIDAATQALTSAGLKVALVTGAGSGTFGMEATSGIYGELQAGSFLFMDADYAGNEADPAQPQFEHALFVKSQVMSVAKEHVVCDAGHKSHAIDSGLPMVLGEALQYFNGGDEHGILRSSPTKNPQPALPSLGDAIWLIPGHCDPTVNLHDVMVGVRGGLVQGRVETIFKVDSRGALT